VTVTVTSRAPGKLILTGEYAVLEGAPALSAAVDLFAVVQLATAEVAGGVLHIVNTDERYAFDTAADGSLSWLEEPGDKGAMLEAVCRVLANAGQSENAARGCQISIDTRDFYVVEPGAADRKKGIGSSGAVAVALAAALCGRVGIDPDPMIAMQAHREFQHKKGSGLDVMTSWHGGIIAMSGRDTQSVTCVSRPDGLLLLPVWTGVPTSTAAMLDRLERFAAESGAEYQGVFVRLCGAAGAAAKAFATDAGTFVAAVAQVAEALKHLDEAGGIGIWSEPHRELASLAAEAGVSYKPSGAGGGDYGIAFAVEESALESFRRQAVRAGYLCEGPGWSSEGLSVDINR
jgi:phosphomevalonate kinase